MAEEADEAQEEDAGEGDGAGLSAKDEAWALVADANVTTPMPQTVPQLEGTHENTTEPSTPASITTGPGPTGTGETTLATVQNIPVAGASANGTGTGIYNPATVNVEPRSLAAYSGALAQQQPQQSLALQGTGTGPHTPSTIAAVPRGLGADQTAVTRHLDLEGAGASIDRSALVRDGDDER